MPRTDMAERIVVSTCLEAGISPASLLVEHYDRMSKNVVAGNTVMASEYREARDIVALVKPQFFIDLADAVRASLSSIVELFKDNRVVRFFGKIGWSLKNLWGILRSGYKNFRYLLDEVAHYIAMTDVGRWTKEELEKLDEYLVKNPRTKRLTGMLVGEILVYLWFIMADFGDPDWDFDLSDITGALGGTYTLSNIFSGSNGAKLLLAVAAGGLVGLTFPWPVAGSVGFTVAIVRALVKKLRKKLEKVRKPVEQEAKELGLA